MMSLWYIIKFFFHRKEELYFSLREILGFCPRHIGLYQLALRHRSLSARDSHGKLVNNERLEFLGDAVIEAIVSDIIYHQFSYAREGFLTTTRSKLVRRSTLNALSSKIGLDRLVRYTRLSESHNSYIGGNAFEALMGAIYLDQGYGRATWFIRRLIKKGYIKVEAAAKKQENFKSMLLEWCQKRKYQVYFSTRALENTSPETPNFLTIVMVESRELGIGRGFSKKESQQKAACKSMDMLNRLPQLRRGLQRRRLYREMVTDLLHSLPELERACGEE